MMNTDPACSIGGIDWLSERRGSGDLIESCGGTADFPM